MILHLCVQAQPDIPVLWVDHGYNRPATYRHAEQLRALLKLNLKASCRASPPRTATRSTGRPGRGGRGGLKQFSALMKLEPFQRGMKELAPTVWITALRKVQNPNRAGLDIVSPDTNFGTLKVSPVFYLTDADMEAYSRSTTCRTSGITSTRQGRREARVRAARRLGRGGRSAVRPRRRSRSLNLTSS